MRWIKLVKQWYDNAHDRISKVYEHIEYTYNYLFTTDVVGVLGSIFLILAFIPFFIIVGLSTIIVSFFKKRKNGV